jgi:hypothetical protein
VEKEKNALSDNACHLFGKGEAVSSILTGSTEKFAEFEGWQFYRVPLSAVPGRTIRKQDTSDMGKTADSVHDKFTAMTEREMDEADAWEYWHQRAHRAEARVKELEAALRAINDLCRRDLVNPFLADEMDRIARAALKEGE